MSKVLELLTGKVSEQKKLAIACASLMSRQCNGCGQAVKVRLHREPDPSSDSCKACIKAAYAAMWKKECECIV